ncbi:sulfurtransferase complex subunit TusB [Halomonas sp. M4R5S39]|uniref:Sulfurtransferase complex subunit TusB n=1 Tax=Halomonas heilongjiangensis TaxID=1387883 RepID=A0A2N7THZ1_9GAMM|nr:MULTISPECIES: sulfurtransferase complex subunit TusB [Halomonas]MDI5984844.1 sulfurtransferase complex subunit TusB [Halomonas kalidii]PMR67806.1 sulfurtransferase complex subunit TusB [Halomonas heilongjiangensis]PXX88826.1 sulfurtransferase complex subunit TusB [Halomonas heilongjiangensis]
MLLHILNRSPAASRVYQQALAAMGPEDRLLLIEDGVQGALPQLVRYFDGLQGRLFALREDLAARGLEGRCEASVQVVDVDGFVDLTEEAERTVSWY